MSQPCGFSAFYDLDQPVKGGSEDEKEIGPFATLGSINIQKGALRDHHNFEPYKRVVAKLKMLARMPEKVMDKHIDLMIDAEKNHIVSVM